MLHNDVSVNKVGNILRKTKDFTKLIIEKVLFESTYPVLFTGISGDKVFLFICYSANSLGMKWIATETTYENLISLLEDRITIREAFMNYSNIKYMLSYHDNEIECNKCFDLNIPDYIIPDYILPTEGEKMNVENGEFDEEIDYFKTQIRLMKLAKEEITMRLDNKEENFEIDYIGLFYIGHFDNSVLRIVSDSAYICVDIPFDDISKFCNLFPDINWENGAFLEQLKGRYLRAIRNDGEIVALKHITKNLTYIIDDYCYEGTDDEEEN